MWQNTQITPEDLPQLIDTDYIKIDKKYLAVTMTWRIILIIILGATLAMSVETLLSIPDFPKVAITVLHVCYGLLYILLILFGYQSVIHQGYLLRQKDLSYQNGWITRRETSVPYNRIQHVEVSQGLIERWLGIGRVKVFTAGGSSSDIQIPGLRLNTANNIRTYLLSQISTKVISDEEE